MSWNLRTPGLGQQYMDIFYQSSSVCGTDKSQNLQEQCQPGLEYLHLEKMNTLRRK